MLRLETITFEEDLRTKWFEADFTMLTNSQASAPIKRVLTMKAAVRPNRFFGEAYVASHVYHDEGWYCPFEWLTSSSWCGDGPTNDNESSEFRKALARHFPRL